VCKESRVKVRCDIYLPCFPFTASGPRLLNDAAKPQLHWKYKGKSNEDIENERKRCYVDREIPAQVS
jgi:hypothetical protein